MKDGIDRNQKANKSKITVCLNRRDVSAEEKWAGLNEGGLTSQFYFLSRYLPSFFLVKQQIRNNN